MADVIVQHVDTLLVERIRALARERQWPVNDVLLHALRNGLGISAAQQFSETLRDPDAPTVLTGHWATEERSVFQEALFALARAPATQFAPESIRVEGAARGAE